MRNVIGESGIKKATGSGTFVTVYDEDGPYVRNFVQMRNYYSYTGTHTTEHSGGSR